MKTNNSKNKVYRYNEYIKPSYTLVIDDYVQYSRRKVISIIENFINQVMYRKDCEVYVDENYAITIECNGYDVDITYTDEHVEIKFGVIVYEYLDNDDFLVNNDNDVQYELPA